MDQTTKKTIGVILTVIAIILVSYYAYRQSKDYIEGSKITIKFPNDGALIDSESLILDGHAQNVAYISLNDSPIFVDSKGDFREKILLLDGYNIISIKAQDRFGKKTEKNIEVVYESKDLSEKISSSSPTTLN